MTTIYICSRCRVVMQHGRATWQCSEYHPERISWIDLSVITVLVTLPVMIMIADKRRVLTEHE